MPTAWEIFAYSGTVALAAVLAGVVARRRHGSWVFFALFLSATLVTTLMMLLWPGRFYTPPFWRAKETVLNFLRFAMALELAYRTFRAFPGALATARWVLLLVLALTFAAVVTVSGPGFESEHRNFESFLSELEPRVLYGSVWLFTAIAALILWYRLPVDPFHKSVVLSYVPYLLIFTVTVSVLGMLGRADWEKGWPIVSLNQLAYLALMVYWARAAWRPIEEPSRPPKVRPPLPPSLRDPISA